MSTRRRLARWHARFLDWTSSHTHHSDSILRVGLGVVILLAGLHKLVAPGPWGEYLAPPLAARWPVSVDATMVAFGLSEVPFGLLLVADRYAALAGAVVAVSMLGVVANLAVGAFAGARVVDVLIRDSGLLVLATGVTLRAVARE